MPVAQLLYADLPMLPPRADPCDGQGGAACAKQTTAYGTRERVELGLRAAPGGARSASAPGCSAARPGCLSGIRLEAWTPWTRRVVLSERPPASRAAMLAWTVATWWCPPRPRRPR